MSAAGDAQRPIFVLGIQPRSGTNYLFDLIRRHPDCAPATPIWEDFLLAHAELLERYARAVTGHWNPDWGVDAGVRRELLRSLGDGLRGFLEARCEGKRVVSKTPCVDNLPLFFDLFPEAVCLVLVRDGRAIVESGVRSFHWHRESAIRGFDAAARRILAFERAGRAEAASRYLRVRYEDLYADQEGVLRKILACCGLDEAVYDFAGAEDLPLRGSSTLRTAPGERVHWEPMSRPADFDPTARFAAWPRARHERFNWIAAESLEAFGYEVVRREGPRVGWWLFNALADLAWGALRPFKGVLGPLRRRFLEWRSRPR